jgi:hypothetical protein
VYGDEDKCNLLDKYFSLISKLEEKNVPLPDFDMKTNNVIYEVFVRSITFFKNGCDMCIFPTRGIFTLTERFVKNNL